MTLHQPERRDQTADGRKDRLRWAWRMKRLLLEEHNDALPALEADEREGYRRDWMRRDRENYAEINALLDATYRAERTAAPDEPIPWMQEKIAGERDDAADAELLSRPRLQRPVVGPTGFDDPLEDFTAYAKLDPDGAVTLTENAVGFEDLETRASTTYVYDDKGAGFFGGEFEHLFDFKLTSFDWGVAEPAYLWTWMVANDVDDGSELWGDEGIGVYRWNYYWGIAHLKTTAIDETWELDIEDTRYYVTVCRDGSTAIAYAYSDSGRTDLVDSVSVTVDGSDAYRYLFALNTSDDGHSDRKASGDVRNLDIQAAEPRGRPAGLIGPLAGRGQPGPAVAR